MEQDSLWKCVIGQAGTGKSTLIRKWQSEREGILLCASTGIAAVNLGDCTTLNSTFGYFDTKSLREKYSDGSLDTKIGKLVENQGVREIAIDELSMIDADQLTILCRALDHHNIYAKHKLGLTLVGDFLQLPPVNASYAFESNEWPRFEANTLKLTKIHRQSDKDFIEALSAARRGDGEECAKHFEGRFYNRVDVDYAGTTICATNREVDSMNAYRLNKLPGNVVEFPTYREGKNASEWKNIPDKLEVKKDALVMLLTNRYNVHKDYITDGEERSIIYANGDLAYFRSKLGEKAALVTLLRNGEDVTVDYVRREHIGITKRGEREVRGIVDYMPLRVAYGSTCYKAQGITLDRCQINIRHPFFNKVPGMVYVALSRARSSNGIRLVGNTNLLKRRCKIDPKVERWI